MCVCLSMCVCLHSMFMYAEKRPYRVGSGDSEKKFGVMTYIEAAEQQGVLPSLVAALYHPKLPTGKE